MSGGLLPNSPSGILPSAFAQESISHSPSRVKTQFVIVKLILCYEPVVYLDTKICQSVYTTRGFHFPKLISSRQSLLSTQTTGLLQVTEVLLEYVLSHCVSPFAAVGRCSMRDYITKGQPIELLALVVFALRGFPLPFQTLLHHL